MTQMEKNFVADIDGDKLEIFMENRAISRL